MADGSVGNTAIVNCSTCENWRQLTRDIHERGECRLAAQNYIIYIDTNVLNSMAAETLYTEWTFFCAKHEPKQK